MPLQTYLSSMYAIKATGAHTKETSFYTPLNNLLDTVGGKLKPHVRCMMQLKNVGAGMPDGGLFTQDQFDRKTHDPKDIHNPARGVVEIKGLAEAVDDTATSAQVDKYWTRYKLVLVTNYRDFVLLGERDGKRVTLERYTLAASESDFWQLAAHPQKAETELGGAFADFLTRVMLYAAPLSDPKDLAWFLASYAREARHRIERASPQAVQQLAALKESLESALGVSFESEKGEHFFRSTLVQTLFYGMFAAWVLEKRKGNKAHFDWRSAAYSLHVPMISALFEQIAMPSKLQALHLVEVLDWTTDALNRVDASAFFTKFQAEHSVQYFYEPFLQAFDPALRKELGVWYTPEEIVRYQVARVDAVLQSELGLPDGLADPNVVVLDPCCGTGAYLVEVLRLIAAKLKAQGADALSAHELKKAAMQRLFGFELLPAPYVVAHLQIGLLLSDLGAPLGLDAQGKDERAGIFLTNALNGWEPAKDPKTHVLPFPEFGEERDAADAVKQTQKILVILGNPPYNAFAGVAQKGEEQDMVAPYKEGLIKKWGIKKFNLDDLYVRFFRLAERRIAEQGGRGVVSFISNYSWVSEPSYVVLREHLLNSFDKLWIENMHGNRKISEYAPDGRTSETVFAQRGFSSGIQQGVVISLWTKNGKSKTTASINYRDDLDDAKAEERRAALLASIDDAQFDSHYQVAQPSVQNRYSFRPSNVGADYDTWPKLAELCELRSDGLFEKRGGALIDIDRAPLESRMRAYFDGSVTWEQLSALDSGLTKKAAGFEPRKTRDKVRAAESFDASRLRRYAVRPFETRWCYYTPINPLWNRPRPSLWAQLWKGNRFLISRLKTGGSGINSPMYCTSALPDGQIISVNPSAIPFWLGLEKTPASTPQAALFDSPSISDGIGQPSIRANLSAAARSYLAALGLPDPDADRDTAALIWHHALAIGYSPDYLAQHADGIRRDWPHIPLPASAEALRASAVLGQQVAVLLDSEIPVPGVTSGTIRDELKAIAVISRIGGGALLSQEFALTAGWGHGGKNGVTMPGRGKVETRLLEASETALSPSPSPASGRGGANVGYLSQQHCLLEKYSACRLGLHHRRLSGHQKMAVLS
ncbi:MAG TPA: type ISP restriction/modification enzyme [Gallionella sp.]|nr:type ISP restriction/modification enzyme [Gallionella sp.]